MKEQDYIDATNLAKARVAYTTIRSTIFDDGSVNSMLNKACLSSLHMIIEDLEARVDS